MTENKHTDTGASQPDSELEQLRARVAYLEALLTKDRADGDLAKKIWEAEQERDAANDYGEYVAIILNKVRQALGVPAEPHQGMPERILEAAEALAAHVERLEAMRQQAQEEYLLEHSDGALDCVTPYDLYDKPDTSLARQKLLWQAEGAQS